MVELLDCTPAEGPPMTNERLPLAELMAKADDGDFLRRVAESVLQILMETDVEGVIGAARYERSGERATYRNGFASGRSTPAWALSTSRSPSCAPAVTSPASSSRGAPSRRRSWR